MEKGENNMNFVAYLFLLELAIANHRLVIF